MKISEGFELRGPPQRVSAIVPFAIPGHTVISVRLFAAGIAESHVYRARVAPFGDSASELRLQLPRHLPPGKYHGTAALDGKEQRVEIEVEPNVQLRLHPDETRLIIGRGNRAEIRLMVANIGNAPVEIPPVLAFGVFEVDSLENAIGRTLRSELGQGERRIDRLMEELRARHGGLVRIRIVQGSGLLGSGVSREITGDLEIPKDLTPGRSYAGAWRIEDASHHVTIEVGGKDTSRSES